MIIKQANQSALSTDPRRDAGEKAERQMAHYLHRAFASSSDLYVLNDLRLEDEQQPEQNGSPGVCQIDHLVIHRWGVFIVESKSTVDEISIRDDGSGGDEWTRTEGGKPKGMPSAIQQARRQGELLRKFLDHHAETLLGKVALGLGAIHTMLHGTNQRGFKHIPIQVLVAIADTGRIRRVNGWQEPDKPFATYVCKADLVPMRIEDEYERHRAVSSILNREISDYGLWSMKKEEVKRVAEFLLERHTPRQMPKSSHVTSQIVTRQTNSQSESTLSHTRSTSIKPAASHTAPSVQRPRCKSCSSDNLHAASGKYGYYWKCIACQGNTAMPTVCDACGAAGRGQGKVRIRKDGPNYWRECAQCNMSEKMWVQK